MKLFSKCPFHVTVNGLFVIFFFLCLLSAWICLVVFSNPILQKNMRIKKQLRFRPGLCPNVLEHMPQGRWLKYNVSAMVQLELDIYLEKARKDFYLPGTLQRLDKNCGNVTFDWLVGMQQPLLWFRALCNPKGETPCCYNNFCTDRSVEMCKCPNCLDMRQQIDAEHARWIPSKPECDVPERNPADMCKSLKRLTVYFIGDSFIRHLYTAFLMLVSGNMYDGALATENMSQFNHSKCLGMYAFSERDCRAYLKFTTSLCPNKTVSLKFFELPKAEQASAILENISKLRNRPRTLVVMGIGIHNDYNSMLTIEKLLKPLTVGRSKTKETWPRVLWMAAHAPGLLKTPRIPAQSYNSVKNFNKIINNYLSTRGIPVLDTFNLTDGVNSFDGAHYGMGVNVVKAKILIEHIDELRTREKW